MHWRIGIVVASLKLSNSRTHNLGTCDGKMCHMPPKNKAQGMRLHFDTMCKKTYAEIPYHTLSMIGRHRATVRYLQSWFS
jgi:hypothetical protein